MAWMVGITLYAARYLDISLTVYHYIFGYDIKICAIIKCSFLTLSQAEKQQSIGVSFDFGDKKGE